MTRPKVMNTRGWARSGLGGATSETGVAMGMHIDDNLDVFLSGRTPRERVT